MPENLWRLVAEDPPPEFSAVLVFREGDCFPVVASFFPGPPDNWVLEEGGDLTTHGRFYPIVVGRGDGWEPTHWMSLEDLGDPHEVSIAKVRCDAEED